MLDRFINGIGMEDKTRVFNCDCLEYMKKLSNNSIDLLITDPPYNITQNDWDHKIDLTILWTEWTRIVKEDGAFVFTTAQPFTTDLINSNREMFRYDLVWEKSIATGFLNANRMPLRGHETICVFYKKLPTYNPQKHNLSTPSFKKRHNTKSASSKNYGAYKNNLDFGATDGSRFPRSVFNIPYEDDFFDSTDTGQTIHPTQKPVSLFRYLISTYSNPGDKVLDCFMGSQSSRLAAFDEGREYIGCEINKDYFEAGCKRFNQHKQQLKLFV